MDPGSFRSRSNSGHQTPRSNFKGRLMGTTSPPRAFLLRGVVPCLNKAAPWGAIRLSSGPFGAIIDLPHLSSRSNLVGMCPSGPADSFWTSILTPLRRLPAAVPAYGLRNACDPSNPTHASSFRGLLARTLPDTRHDSLYTTLVYYTGLCVLLGEENVRARPACN